MLQTEADDLAIALPGIQAADGGYAEARPLAARAPRAASVNGSLSDAALVARAQAGQRAAMTELHRRYARMIHAIVLARVAPRDADDLTQDVFLQAINKLSRLREPAKFGGWLAMIARNTATDHHRRRRPATAIDDALASSESSAHAKLQAKRALQAIRALPKAYREVLLMRLVEGMTGPEIAQRANLTPGSVRVNLHRGMKLLKAALQEPI
jgi:RNA polymerase sigma-70 factor (ECF subfamily)